MKQIKVTFPNVFMKTKSLQFVLGIAVAMSFSNNLNAQNSSYDANTIPITGTDNCAFGAGALDGADTPSNENVAVGVRALGNFFGGTSGDGNTGVGFVAVGSNTTGSDNSGCGHYALCNSSTGTENTAMGAYALRNNTTGTQNSSLGAWANIYFGNTTNSTALGYGAVANTSNKVRIGNASVTVIEGQVAYSWPSDGRFKTNVKEEDVKGLEFIKKLRPVVYNFDTRKFTEFWTKNMPDNDRKHYLNQDFTASTNVRQSGFIAQEVESAAKAVNYNFNGLHVPENESDNYSLAYAEFVVPLVKGMQEQQKMIEDQKQMIDKLQQQINDLQKGGTTGIGNALSIEGASMEQNVPNPFSHETVIAFNLPKQISNAYMTVYDLSGREIKTLPIAQRGSSTVNITSEQLEAGMYIYSIIADGKIVDSKRMIVSK